DFAFRQAFAFAPNNLEVIFRYVSLLMMDGRTEDALRVAGAAQSLDPDNGQLGTLVSDLTRIKRTTGE
ncbi:MAG TPA: tetratricopeptide repeat protein, partial [Blastocatellia bacterium]|nr:tetratricopeptide repeat protein [Blastocatellia bacterium]